jgi:hypothetical protein
MSRTIAHFATIGIPIISKMHREMSSERKPDGKRQPDCNGCQGRPLRSDCRVRVAMCAELLATIENRFRCGSAHFKLRTHFLQSGPACFDLFLLLCNRSSEVRHFALFLDERRVRF